MKVVVGVILAAVLIQTAFTSGYNSGRNYGGRNYGGRRQGGYRRYQQPSYNVRGGSAGGNRHHGDGYHSRDYGYKKVICPKLDNPANGKVEVKGRYPGDKATYSCNTGFSLAGLTTRTCQRDGSWSQKAPICKRIDCGQLPDIANGKVNIHPDTRLGSKATYTCNPGFILQGRSTRTCQADGSYDGQEPSCQPVSCGSLSDPTNGWVHVSPSSALLGAVAIYRCKLGYVLSHSNSRTCTTTGAWSGTAPTCNRVNCGPIPRPKPNSQVVSSQGTFLGDETEYSCSNGYDLVGSPTIYCQNDGRYSDTSPTCNPVDCGAPDPPDPNGDLVVGDTTLGNVASYTCDAGFTSDGSATATCQASGTWSSDAPVCNPVDCGKLQAPANGDVYFYPGTTFTSRASFVCRRGFRLVGSQVRTCQADGSWSGVQPVCKKIQCPKLKVPKYGKLYVSGNYPGDHAVYDCSYGYKLVGKRRRTCRHTGKWDGSAANCVKDDTYYGGSSHYGRGNHYYDGDNKQDPYRG